MLQTWQPTAVKPMFQTIFLVDLQRTKGSYISNITQTFIILDPSPHDNAV